MQEELLFGHPFNGKQMIEYFENFHAFYEPVVEYMDKFSRWDSQLCVRNKGQFFDHKLLPLCAYVLILIKHEEEAELLEKLLHWLHWKSEFT